MGLASGGTLGTGGPFDDGTVFGVCERPSGRLATETDAEASAPVSSPSKTAVALPFDAVETRPFCRGVVPTSMSDSGGLVPKQPNVCREQCQCMTERSGTRSKVQRVIDEYELAGMGEQLESYWTGDDEDQYSLRELADVFNRAVLRAALDQAGASPLEGEVENTYRLLTDDSVSSGVRTETKNALARDGVDVDELEDDFVTHQAIHTYLTKHRGVNYESSADETDQVEKGAETIQRLRTRTSAVTETTLENLASTDRITLGDFDVLVDVRVLCDTCGRSYTADELLENGGCACDHQE